MRAAVILGLIAGLALMACQPVPAPREDACGAAGMQSFIGQDRSVLAAMTFPAGTRIIEAGSPVTMDFNPRRLNIVIGSTGRIERVSCG